MLIERFVVPANELADVGLQSIEMNRLGRFVALTGKNGAGKSRILNKLNQLIPQRNHHLANLHNYDHQIQSYEHAIIRSLNPENPSQSELKIKLEDALNNKSFVTDRMRSPLSTHLWECCISFQST